MIANGDIKPLIAVAPTYYTASADGGDMGGAVEKIENFTSKELVNELIPAVEGKYSTYAETTDLEGIKASREHRGYTGFSMGSLSTWYTFLNASDYFYFFTPMSGDCWINGRSNASGSAYELQGHCEEKGYDEDDFFIYAVTGSKDIAHGAMSAQMKSMQSNSPAFKFLSEASETGNICFRVQPEAQHSYNFLPVLTEDVISPYDRVMNGLNQCMREKNINVEILVCPFEYGGLFKKYRYISSAFCTGAIVFSLSETDMDDLKSQEFDVPLVVFNRMNEKYSTVYVDDYNVGYKVAIGPRWLRFLNPNSCTGKHFWKKERIYHEEKINVMHVTDWCVGFCGLW